jgi:clan AA aspartic protease (TIGR02281 family)
MLRAHVAHEAYGTFDRRRGVFSVRVTLPSITRGAFETVMEYDSCATYVVLAHADFDAIGLDRRRMRFDVEADTVSGVLLAAPVELPLMGVGQIRLNNVRAIVPQTDCGVSLLGQAALRKLSAVTQQGDTLIFRR